MAINYIVREVPAEWSNFADYFDCDGFNGCGGDYLTYLFIVQRGGWGRLDGYNVDEYKRVMDQAEEIINAAEDADGYGEDITEAVAEALTAAGIAPDGDMLRRLVVWAEDADAGKTEDIADFLTITTGHYWTTAAARGYCQGDYAELVYCPERYTEGVEAIGEIWLGAAKEFEVVGLDDDGNETDTCGGYYVADCQAWRDEDYKRIVCAWAGIAEDETRLEMIDGCTTRTEYNYRIA